MKQKILIFILALSYFLFHSCTKKEHALTETQSLLCNAKWKLKSVTYQLASGDSTAFSNQVLPPCSLDDYSKYIINYKGSPSSGSCEYHFGELKCSSTEPAMYKDAWEMSIDESIIHKSFISFKILKLDKNELVLLDTMVSFHKALVIDSFINVP